MSDDTVRLSRWEIREMERNQKEAAKRAQKIGKYTAEILNNVEKDYMSGRRSARSILSEMHSGEVNSQGDDVWSNVYGNVKEAFRKRALDEFLAGE